MRSDLERDEEMAKLSIPQLIEKITKLTEEYSAEIGRVSREILIRSMLMAGSDGQEGDDL
uniref:Uncharacterized protein n=1 Tax=uncultured bacterium Contig643 TaxID=1393602 RepID=W0FH99_9BACT|nr:hypothetical protein [uncultured bacterium Contig643]